MLNILIQLHIEQKLSGAKAYLASFPELGVPLGIFNYKDEPNKNACVKSIKEQGIKGNPYSFNIAKQLGIINPLPSYIQDVVNENDIIIDFDCPSGFYFVPGIGCVPIGNGGGDDEDDPFFFQRVTNAVSDIAYFDFDVHGLDQLFSDRPMSVGLTLDPAQPEDQGSAYGFIPSVLGNWEYNMLTFNDEFDTDNFNTDNYYAAQIQANGNLNYKDWLDGTTSNNDRRAVDMLGNPFYNEDTGVGPGEEASMLLFADNACRDFTVTLTVPDEPDNQAEESVGYFTFL